MDNNADTEKVEHQITAWNAAVNGGNADGIIALVSDDFEMIPPGEDPVSGAAAKQFLRGFFDFDLSLDGKTLELEITGDLAVRRYSYRLSLVAKGGGETQVLKGQGIHLLRRGPDGLWKFCKDIYN